jgi:uncharacterized damage-inducible protein DinB
MKTHLLSQFDFHHRLYNNVLDGFDDAESNARLHGDSKVNHVKYLAGHLLNSQYGLASLSGLQVEPKWSDLFAPMGLSRAQDDLAYPALDDIKSEWNEMHRSIHSGFLALSSGAMDATAPEPFGELFADNLDFGNTLGGVWAFLNHHQAYHIGQIGLLRRGFGKPPMRYD